MILFKTIPAATCLRHIYFLQPMSASQDDFITVFSFTMSQFFLHKYSLNESNLYLSLSINTQPECIELLNVKLGQKTK